MPVIMCIGVDDLQSHRIYFYLVASSTAGIARKCGGSLLLIGRDVCVNSQALRI